MAAHGIHIFDINLWREGSPPLMHERLTAHTRSGTDGVALQKVGRWMEPSDSIVVMHIANYSTAYATLTAMHSLPDQGLVPVKYNNILLSTLGLQYFVLDVRLESLRSVPRIKGPDYDFVGGAELAVRVSLVPQEIAAQ